MNTCVSISPALRVQTYQRSGKPDMLKFRFQNYDSVPPFSRHGHCQLVRMPMNCNHLKVSKGHTNRKVSLHLLSSLEQRDFVNRAYGDKKP